MSFHSILLILAIHAVALVSPGPDFAIVTRLSIVSGRKGGLWAGAGVVAVGMLLASLGGLLRKRTTGSGKPQAGKT